MNVHLVRFECFNRSCPLAPWKDGKRCTTSPGAVDFTAARSQMHRLFEQFINPRGRYLQPLGKPTVMSGQALPHIQFVGAGFQQPRPALGNNADSTRSIHPRVVIR